MTFLRRTDRRDAVRRLVLLAGALVAALGCCHASPLGASANTTSLYACNELELNALAAALDSSDACLASAPSATGCAACASLFQAASVRYNALVSARQCFVQLHQRALASRVLSALIQRPCLATAGAGFPAAGAAARASCASAVRLTCAGDSIARAYQSGWAQPVCDACDPTTGLCGTQSTGTAVSPAASVALFELACSATSVFAASTIAATTNTSYSASLVKLGTAQAMPIIPGYDGLFAAPPLRTDGNSVLIGLAACAPGLLCSAESVQLCPRGYSCSPTTGALVKTRAGFFSPEGMPDAIACSALSACPEGVGAPRQFEPTVFALGLILVLALALTLVKLWHKRVLARDAARLATRDAEAEAPGTSVPLGRLAGSSPAPHSPPRRAWATSTSNDASADARASPAPRLDAVSFAHVSLAVGSRRILCNVSGRFAAGTVTAIIGPSGCGKTSLINALLGSLPLEAGSTVTFGRTHGAATVPARLVPQNDVMIRCLTVYELLSHAARLAGRCE